MLHLIKCCLISIQYSVTTLCDQASKFRNRPHHSIGNFGVPVPISTLIQLNQITDLQIVGTRGIIYANTAETDFRLIGGRSIAYSHINPSVSVYHRCRTTLSFNLLSEAISELQKSECLENCFLKPLC